MKKEWRLTNGDFEIELCRTCRQPMYSGHVDCTCDNNHPDNCDRPTYETLFSMRNALVDTVKQLRSETVSYEEADHDFDYSNNSGLAELSDSHANTLESLLEQPQ